MIKRIEILDKAAEVGTKWRDIPCNMRFGDAYFYSLEAGNDLINFGDVIWDYDIDEILENCRRFGIERFTISSTFSSLIITIAEFQKRGCKLEGLIEINSRFDDWKAGLEESVEKKEFQPLRLASNPKAREPGGAFWSL